MNASLSAPQIKDHFGQGGKLRELFDDLKNAETDQIVRSELDLTDRILRRFIEGEKCLSSLEEFLFSSLDWQQKTKVEIRFDRQENARHFSLSFAQRMFSYFCSASFENYEVISVTEDALVEAHIRRSGCGDPWPTLQMIAKLPEEGKLVSVMVCNDGNEELFVFGQTYEADTLEVQFGSGSRHTREALLNYSPRIRGIVGVNKGPQIFTPPEIRNRLVPPTTLEPISEPSPEEDWLTPAGRELLISEVSESFRQCCCYDVMILQMARQLLEQAGNHLML